MAKTILLIIAIVLTSIFTGLIVGFSACSAQESRGRELPFFEPFESDEDMWQNIMAAYPDYNEMSDLEKTIALRNWASQHMYVSGNVNVYNHNLFNNQHPYLIFNHFATFHNGNAGVMCTGYAHALCVLYSYAGFSNLKYDYGGDGCSHSVTLVRIMDNNTQKIIVQDPYFDYYYTWPNDTVMSVYDVFNEVEAQRYNNIVPVYERTIDYAVFTPLTNGNLVHLGNIQLIHGAERVADIDSDSVVYRFWYTPENYYKTPGYIAARETLYGDTSSDLDLIIEKRLIVHFGNSITHVRDFSLIEGSS